MANPKMNWEAADRVQEFARFKQKCELMFRSVHKNATNDTKVAYILLWSGDEGLKIFNSLNLGEEERKSPEHVFEGLRKHIEPFSCFRVYRYQLQSMRQGELSVDDFVKDMRAIANNCKFANDDEVNDRLLDQLIWGCSSPSAQKELLGKQHLTLENAIDFVRTEEATKRQMESLSVASSTVCSVRDRKARKPCNKCGRLHAKAKTACPAFGTVCNHCGKPNHWAKMCRSRAQHSGDEPRRRLPRRNARDKDGQNKRSEIHAATIVNNSTAEHYDEIPIDFGSVNLATVTHNTSESDTREEAYVTLEVYKHNHENSFIKGKVDTGASRNIMPVETYKNLYPRNFDSLGYPKQGVLKESDLILSSFGGPTIQHFGIASIPCIFKSLKFTCSFFIADCPGPVLLGLPTSRYLKLVTINCPVEIHAATSPTVISECQTHQNSQPKEPAILPEIPPRPWHTISSDLFLHRSRWYIIVTDLYSKFPFIRQIRDTSSKSVIDAMRGIFSEHGIPSEIITDNGTHFTSAEMLEFSRIYGFSLTTSSPHYPRGHGLVERQIQTIKNTLTKCAESQFDPHLSLLCLRATPLDHNTQSPAGLLQGRVFKTTLPSRIPNPRDSEIHRKRLEDSRTVQNKYYDMGAKSRPDFLPNQPVNIQHPVSKTWSPAQIVQPEDTPRSYYVETP